MTLLVLPASISRAKALSLSGNIRLEGSEDITAVIDLSQLTDESQATPLCRYSHTTHEPTKALTHVPAKRATSSC
jgi:hypothetical protein